MTFLAIKRPVWVQCWQVTDEQALPAWAKDACRWQIHHSGKDIVLIDTIDGGIVSANIGDYLLCGTIGEVYPCRKDIFEKTYERKMCGISADEQLANFYDDVAEQMRKEAHDKKSD